MNRVSKPSGLALGVVRVLSAMAWWGMLLFLPVLILILLGGESYWAVPVDVSIHEPSFHVVRVDDRPAPELHELAGELRIATAEGLGLLPNGVFFLLYLLVFYIVHQLRGVVRSLPESPFTLDNCRRLTRIGWVLLATQLVFPLIGLAQGWWMSANVESAGVDLAVRPPIDLTGIFCAALLLVLAEIFRRGAQLEDEQALTV